VCKLAVVATALTSDLPATAGCLWRALEVRAGNICPRLDSHPMSLQPLGSSSLTKTHLQTGSAAEVAVLTQTVHPPGAQQEPRMGVRALARSPVPLLWLSHMLGPSRVLGPLRPCPPAQRPRGGNEPCVG
jgi:hypothetical protein